MNLNHQIIRFSYARISESIQAELNFLSALSENTDDERFKQSLIEMIYSLSDLSEFLQGKNFGHRMRRISILGTEEPAFFVI
ncbi:hypothetical protein [Allocoleopsis sp.]|uniref:hypothetical protein n=1 Tax=Allocoleopsis sp. TaxID=3088169 RepID=UPI002FD4415F